jgi:CDP-diacylglycerol--glycerol-3-phosphate 3-phosphatidyltransferase
MPVVQSKLIVTMANLLTLSRLLLLIAVAALFYAENAVLQLLNFVLIIVMFSTDALDGYFARKRNEASLFGALFDIAGDRIVELTLWIVAADNDLIPIWVPLVFIARGVAVDTVRAGHAAARGETPFGLMRSRFGKFVVAGRFMRISYAVVKACAFCGLAALDALPELSPQAWAAVGWLWTALTYGSVYLAVVLCVARGLPVLIEFVYAEKNTIMPRR